MSSIQLARVESEITLDRVAVCLSGSGFRATVFQMGALRRLNEFGILGSANDFHAVSAGGIVLGALAVHWDEMGWDENGRRLELDHYVARPTEGFARSKMRLTPAVESRLKPGNWTKLLRGRFTETDRLIEIIDRKLTDGRKLVELPLDGPVFHWHATSLRTGGAWEFTPDRIGEVRLGHRRPDNLRVASAVASTIVEPSELPPVIIRSNAEEFESGPDDPATRRLRRTVLLVDGAVHDPLAIDSALSVARTVIVCDGGTTVKDEPAYDDWVGGRMFRTLAIQQSRAVESRRRWLVESIRKGQLEGTYIGLSAHHADYGLPDSSGYSVEVAQQIWRMPGRYQSLSNEEVSLLANHGYTIADAAVRRLLAHRIRVPAPLRLPYPEMQPIERNTLPPTRQAG